jgi:hypothetical protein
MNRSLALAVLLLVAAPAGACPTQQFFSAPTCSSFTLQSQVQFVPVQTFSFQPAFGFTSFGPSFGFSQQRFFNGGFGFGGSGVNVNVFNNGNRRNFGGGFFGGGRRGGGERERIRINRTSRF